MDTRLILCFLFMIATCLSLKCSQCSNCEHMSGKFSNVPLRYSSFVREADAYMKRKINQACLNNVVQPMTCPRANRGEIVMCSTLTIHFSVKGLSGFFWTSYPEVRSRFARTNTNFALCSPRTPGVPPSETNARTEAEVVKRWCSNEPEGTLGFCRKINDYNAFVDLANTLTWNDNDWEGIFRNVYRYAQTVITRGQYCSSTNQTISVTCGSNSIARKSSSFIIILMICSGLVFNIGLN